MAAPVVVVEGLTKRFGSNRGVCDVSFEVASGEVFGFLGPNGAGKSTTIRLLLGLYRPDAGRMRVFGLDPTRDGVAIHRRVGYLPGELALYPRLTGRQHLDRFARARRLTDLRYRDELVERFGVELDRPVRTLSKGNRQKIGLVLAFMHRPDLLILDEPTSGLDPLLQEEFADWSARRSPRAARCSSPRTNSTRCSASSTGSRSSGTGASSSPTRSTACAGPRRGPSSSASPQPVDPAPFAALDGVQVVRSRRAGHAVGHRPDRAAAACRRRPGPGRDDRPACRPRRAVSRPTTALAVRRRRMMRRHHAARPAAAPPIAHRLHAGHRRSTPWWSSRCIRRSRTTTSLNELTDNGSAVAALFGANGPLTTPPDG